VSRGFWRCVTSPSEEIVATSPTKMMNQKRCPKLVSYFVSWIFRFFVENQTFIGSCKDWKWRWTESRGWRKIKDPLSRHDLFHRQIRKNMQQIKNISSRYDGRIGASSNQRRSPSHHLHIPSLQKESPHTSRSALQTRLPFDGANHALWSDGNYDATSRDLEKGWKRTFTRIIVGERYESIKICKNSSQQVLLVFLSSNSFAFKCSTSCLRHFL